MRFPLALLAVLALSACAPSLDYRYRVTVEIDTPEGVRSSSNVIEAQWLDDRYTWWQPPDARNLRMETIGDAVFVDLSQGRHVVATLVLGPNEWEDRGIETIVPDTLGISWFGDFEVFRAAVEAALVHKTVAVVPSASLPQLVTFADVNDPWSGRMLHPDSGDFASTFGPGYALRRVTIQLVPVGIWPFNKIGISGEPITRSIEERLPFLRTHREELRSILTDLPPRWLPHSHYFTRD